MSTLLRCQNIGHSLGDRRLFCDMSLSLERRDHVGLVGYNGSGKSTLLSLLAGAREPDEGEVVRRRGLRLSMVEQFLDDAAAEKGVLEAVEERLEETTDPHRAEAVLSRLRFDESAWDRPCSDLSGGQQNLVAFARAIVNEPDLVLLDEPSNHLDWQTLLRFEAYLERHARFAYLVVSHDRDFLDRVTQRTVVLRDQHAYAFDLPFSKAREKLIAADIAAAEARAAEEKEIARLRATAKRLATWGKVYDNEKLARKAKSIEKRAERAEAERTFVTNGPRLSLNVNADEARSHQLVLLEANSISTPDGRRLFDVERFQVRPGERVAILAPNGTGKTTFLKHLVALYRNERERARWFSPQCRLGYYDQELAEIQTDGSIRSVVAERARAGDEVVKQTLIRAGFPYEMHRRRVSSLSGGERARVLFVLLELLAPSLLVLDEPTNHLDIEGREALESQLLDQNVSLVVTAHDRRFVQNVCNRFFAIIQGRLEETYEPSWELEPSPAPTSADVEGAPAFDEESILSQLLELETKLEADMQRKPKFQKPKLQQEWRAEIARLTALLDRAS
jgi:ATP-binding cassette subfamily F protein 3